MTAQPRRFLSFGVTQAENLRALAAPLEGLKLDAGGFWFRLLVEAPDEEAWSAGWTSAVGR